MHTIRRMTMRLALALLALTACGTPMQPGDAGADAPAPDDAATADGAATALNATEMALVGVWSRDRAETATEGFTWRLELRADRTSTLTYSTVALNMGGCVRDTMTATRAWRASADGTTLTFGDPTRTPITGGPCSGGGTLRLETTATAETAAGDLALAVMGATMTTRPAGMPASANVTWARQ